uniref:NADH-ubiquinone oxidoreductase chain 5 n=1 Tax=Discolomatidae sp. 1 ACP-2013 TaxID=1434484 RepID=A0A3G5FNC9_9CUCU|nr:NADH dehydrogenase subunit 5 [Discolomatidae sp. 1 ACP-2013]
MYYKNMFLLISLISYFMSLDFLIIQKIYLIEFNFFSYNSCSISMVILLDWISFMFISFVMFISSMILNYSYLYMSNDKYKYRFMYLVILFVVSMILLIISPNMISILLGWDGLGLVSYLLVVYYQNLKSYSAGMLTILMNRVGDVFLLFVIVWFMNYGSWNFIFYINFIDDYFIKLIGYLVIIGAFTKSAQIPFSAWLPAAMAAPTPVSALVHSSTLVTAGIYLLIRFNFIFNYLNLNIFIFLSLMTMFMAGLGASFELDLKKIIALSTLSQLGLMMSILLIGSWELTFFHLLTHALFKALMFMCAGMFIHMYFDCQDIRYMGHMIYLMPLTSLIFNISNLSLCGLPFFSGFYSKDLMMEMLSMNYMNLFIYMIFYISIGLTMSYSIRLSFYLIFGEFNYLNLMNFKENLDKMMKSMLLMLIMVIFSGSMLSWILFNEPYFINLSYYMKFLTLVMVMLGLYLGLEFSKFKLSYLNWSLKNLLISYYFSSMWNLSILSSFYNNKFLNLGKKYYKLMDQGWLEYMGSQNLFLKFIDLAKFMQKIFGNFIKLYFIMIILFILMIFMNI